MTSVPNRDRVASELARVDEAPRCAELGVLHVMVEELEAIHGADIDLGRERIALIRLPRVQPAAEVSDRGAEAERCTGRQVILRAEIQRARALDLRADAAALTRAVDAKLYDLVVEAGVKALGDRRGVRTSEDDIAGKDEPDDLVELVLHLLLTDVQDVEGERDGTRAMHWERRS